MSVCNATWNPTMRSIMDYLNVELAHGAKFISYSKIGREILPQRSKHAVRYSIEMLVRQGQLKIVNKKLSLI